MSTKEFLAYYWMKSDLVSFARRLGLRTDGYKPELTERIRRRLAGLPDRAAPTIKAAANQRDSDAPLKRSTRVINYFSDARTRTFFESQIGSHFHFTSHLNQWRLARRNLTYGHLIDEWLAEERRRKDPAYKAPLAKHGKYNRFVRDYFADKGNEGKSMADAAAAWNAVKFVRGDPRYRRAK